MNDVFLPLPFTQIQLGLGVTQIEVVSTVGVVPSLISSFLSKFLFHLLKTDS